MEIEKEIRSFEADHGPDGWPAVRMRQISALCDEVDRLKAIEAAACDFLKTMDRMDEGCENPGFRGWQNGHGEPCGDDAQAARETLARLLFNHKIGI